MVVGAKVCDLTEDLLWFVCGLYVRILTSPLSVWGYRLLHAPAEWWRERGAGSRGSCRHVMA